MSLGGNASSLGASIMGMVGNAAAGSKTAPSAPATPPGSRLERVARGERPEPHRQAEPRPAARARTPEANPAEAVEPEAPEIEAVAEGEAEAETTEAVKRPDYWDSDDEWNSLSPDAQERIAKRESERELLHKTRETETVEVRGKHTKAHEEARKHVTEQLTHLNGLMHEIVQAQLGGGEPNFEQILREQGSEAYGLAKEDWAKRTKSLGELGQKVKAAIDQNRASALKVFEDWKAEQQKLLVKRMPDWADPKKAEAKWAEYEKHLTSDYGFKPEELQGLVDHRYYPIIDDAVAWRKHKANLPKTAAALKAAPKMARPGTTTKASAAERRINEATQMHRKRGNAASLAGVLTAMASKG